MRIIKDKVLSSILNRKKRGFTRIDIQRDSGASMRYVHDIVSEQLSVGKLEEYNCNGRVKMFREPRKVAAKPVVAAEKPAWIKLLESRKEVLKTWTAVAEELGVSKTTISLIMSGSYGADTSSIKKAIYGKYGELNVKCPFRGEITICDCSNNKRNALTLGIRGPAHIRKQRRQCLACEL